MSQCISKSVPLQQNMDSYTIDHYPSKLSLKHNFYVHNVRYFILNGIYDQNYYYFTVSYYKGVGDGATSEARALSLFVSSKVNQLR